MTTPLIGPLSETEPQTQPSPLVYAQLSTFNSQAFSPQPFLSGSSAPLKLSLSRFHPSYGPISRARCVHELLICYVETWMLQIRCAVFYAR